MRFHVNSYLPKVLITGADGQLGTALCQHALAADWHIIACSRTDMDITDTTSVELAITTHTPDIIINTAAYTAVDNAEQESNQALHINYIGAQNIAIACATHQLPLIHLSTDYIFDGNKNTPYTETDVTNAINTYGKSKCLGEEAVRKHCEQHIILRVSGVFSEHKSNFYKTILRLANENNELRIVADQFTCPTYADDIAATIFVLAKQLSCWGTYHYCSSNPVSWYQFASAIVTHAKQYKKSNLENIIPIATADYHTAAKRPMYSVLDCTKIQTDYSIKQPNWEAALKNLLEKMT